MGKQATVNRLIWDKSWHEDNKAKATTPTHTSEDAWISCGDAVMLTLRTIEFENALRNTYVQLNLTPKRKIENNLTSYRWANSIKMSGKKSFQSVVTLLKRLFMEKEESSYG